MKTNLRNSRPAGNVFVHEGQLYRPSQDCRDSYGGALCINRIDELNIERFRETPVRWISPDPAGPYPNGFHTLSGNAQFSLVDGKRHTFPLGFLMRRFLMKRLKLRVPGFTYAKVRPAPPAPWTKSTL